MKRLVLTLTFALFAITMFAGNYISRNVEPYAPAFAGTNDPEELEGYVEINGVFYSFQYGPMIQIPSGTTYMVVTVTHPILTSYTFSAVPANQLSGQNQNWAMMQSNSGFSGTTLNVTGYCPESGNTVTKVMAFYN